MKLGSASIMFVLTFLLVATMASAQGYIGLSRKQCQEKMQRHFTAKFKAEINTTDSLITVQLKDSTVRPAKMQLAFDEKGKCIMEKTSFDCDSCYKKLLTSALKARRIRWKQLDDNSWIAQYARKMILLTNPDEPFTVTIRRHSFSRKMYATVIRKS